MQLTQLRAATESLSGTEGRGRLSIAEQVSRQWLQWLSSRLPAFDALALYRVEANSAQLQTALPDGHGFDARHAKLALSCIDALKVLVSQDQEHSKVGSIAVPLKINNAASEFVLIFYGPLLNAAELKSMVQLVRWAAFYLHGNAMLGAPSTVTPAVGERKDSVDDFSASVLRAVASSHSFDALCISIVNAIARISGSARVSLGSVGHREETVLAISGHAQLDPKRLLVKQIGAGMRGALLESPAIYPISHDASHDASEVTDVLTADVGVKSRAQQALFELSGGQPSVAIGLPTHTPVSTSREYVLLLEAPAGKPLSAERIHTLEKTLAPIANLLMLYRESEAPFYARLWARLHGFFTLPGSRQPWSLTKKLTVALPCILVFLALWPTQHRVSARAYIEAADRQVLVAAQAGYIKSSHARAGDRVNEGELLATLDISDLALEADKWRTEQSKNAQAYRQALAIHDRAELSRLRADAARIETELAQVKQQLVRSELRAPFTGVLLSGDLNQMLGAPVEQGQVLYEIGSAEQYRLIVEVDEHDIGYVAADQGLSVKMSSLPSMQWDATVQNILPVALAEQGKSVFRLPALIAGDTDVLKPGMQGIAKIHIGDQSVLWVWTRAMVDRLRFLAWKLGLY